jgi:single-strand DNA-binding protein
LTAEPTLWITKNNTTGAEVKIGSTPRWVSRETGEWQEGEPTYYSVKCWRNLAVNVKGSLHKGDRVLVRGKFITRSWTDEQQRRHVVIEVEADSVGHDLTYAWSFVNRGPRAPRNLAQNLADGEMARAEVEGSGSLGGSGSDDLPPVPDGQGGGYMPDDYPPVEARDQFATDTPGSPDPEEVADMGEATTELVAEAVPF